MKIVAIAVFSAFVAVRCVAMDASELVRQNLHQRGLRVGYNSDRNAYITIADSEVYRSRSETERNKAAECAYMKALAKMAMAVSKMENLAGSVSSRSISVSNRSIIEKSVVAKSLLQCETKGSESGYKVSLALVSSEKVYKAASAALSSNIAAMPQHRGVHITLPEWVEQNYLSFLGSSVFHDSPSHFWVLGVVSQEADEANSDLGRLIQKAAYMAESAFGGRVEVAESSSMAEKPDVTPGGRPKEAQEMFREDVSQHHEYLLLYTSDDARLERRIKLTPYLRINPNSSRINWFVRTGVRPATGKRIRVAIAAIDSDDLHEFASPDVKPDLHWNTSTKQQ